MRRIVALIAVIGAVLASSASAALDEPLVLPVEPVGVTVPVTTEAWQVLDADGIPAGEVDWRVVKGVGNCCENFLITTPDGRLANFGGTYLHFSDDEGATWKAVRPPTPLLSGEGAVTVAPGGDIVGVGWDPYTGDHLQSFRFDAAEDTWWYAEAPIKTPFYDRPWIAAVSGPLTIAGQEVPYATVIRGGWPSKEVLYYAHDGLVYALPAVRQAEAAARPTVTGALPVAAEPIADYNQSHAETLVMPLGDGAAFGVAGFPGSSGCSSGSFVALEDLAWACHQAEDATDVPWQVADSEARLHAVRWSPTGTLTYASSPDGGATVRELELALPDGYEVTSGRDVDLKANAAAGVVAVATHARRTGEQTAQHMVFVLRRPADDPSGDYAVDRILLVGDGDLAFGSGVGTSVRFDFASLALLPDGRVAVSFNDTRHHPPAVAIELPGDA